MLLNIRKAFFTHFAMYLYDAYCDSDNRVKMLQDKELLTELRDDILVIALEVVSGHTTIATELTPDGESRSVFPFSLQRGLLLSGGWVA